MEKVKRNQVKLKWAFGHRVYKNFDPRAKVMKETCDEVLGELGIKDPQLELAMKLEQTALNDLGTLKSVTYIQMLTSTRYHSKNHRYSNLYVAIIFALVNVLPGWISHWLEMHSAPSKSVVHVSYILATPSVICGC